MLRLPRPMLKLQMGPGLVSSVLYEVCGTLLSVQYRLVAQREKFINKFFIDLFILKKIGS